MSGGGKGENYDANYNAGLLALETMFAERSEEDMLFHRYSTYDLSSPKDAEGNEIVKAAGKEPIHLGSLETKTEQARLPPGERMAAYDAGRDPYATEKRYHLPDGSWATETQAEQFIREYNKQNKQEYQVGDKTFGSKEEAAEYAYSSGLADRPYSMADLQGDTIQAMGEVIPAEKALYASQIESALGKIPLEDERFRSQHGLGMAQDESAGMRLGLDDTRFQSQHQLDLAQIAADRSLVDPRRQHELTGMETEQKGWELQRAQATSALGRLPHEDERFMSQHGLGMAQDESAMARLPHETEHGIAQARFGTAQAREGMNIIQQRAPVVEAFYNDAMQGYDRDRYANQHGADVALQFDDSRRLNNIQMGAMGARPGSTRSMAQQNAQMADRALAVASGKSQGREFADDKRFNRLNTALGGM